MKRGVTTNAEGYGGITGTKPGSSPALAYEEWATSGGNTNLSGDAIGIARDWRLCDAKGR